MNTGKSEETDGGAKSHVEVLAEMRDYKRRRQSYRAKNVHITKRSAVDVSCLGDLMLLYIKHLFRVLCLENVLNLPNFFIEVLKALRFCSKKYRYSRSRFEDCLHLEGSCFFSCFRPELVLYDRTGDIGCRSWSVL